MTFEIKEIAELIITGFSLRCPPEDCIHEIPKARDMLLLRKNEIAHMIDGTIQIGFFKELPCNDDENAYFIGYQVTNAEQVPDGMINIVIPAKQYACMHYKGPIEELGHAYGRLKEWIQQEGFLYQQEHWTLESHPTTVDWRDKEFEVEICLPLNYEVGKESIR